MAADALHPIDLGIIAGYFAVVILIGGWAARQVTGCSSPAAA